MRRKGMFLLLVIALPLIYGCTVPTGSYLKPNREDLTTVEKLAVYVEGHPEFSHIGAVNSESTGLVVLAQLVGAGVDTMSRNAKDKETAGSIIKPEDLLSKGRQDFTNTLIDTLQNSGRFKTVKHTDSISQAKKEFDAILRVKITKWGSRENQSGSNVVIPFMDIVISMNLSSDKMIWEEAQTTVFNKNHTLSDYKTKQGLFADDFQSLTQKAGRRSATQLLSF